MTKTYKQTTEEQRERMMDIVIDNFNFDKVHRAMTALDWKWVTETGELELPSVDRIRSSARRLLRESYRLQWKYGDDCKTVGSGGLQASYSYADHNGDANFNLAFVLTEENSHDYYQPNYPEGT